MDHASQKLALLKTAGANLIAEMEEKIKGSETGIQHFETGNAYSVRFRYLDIDFQLEVILRTGNLLLQDSKGELRFYILSNNYNQNKESFPLLFQNDRERAETAIFQFAFRQSDRDQETVNVFVLDPLDPQSSYDSTSFIDFFFYHFYQNIIEKDIRLFPRDSVNKGGLKKRK